MRDDICRSCGQKKHKYPGRLGDRPVRPPYPRKGSTLLDEANEAEHESRCQKYIEGQLAADLGLMPELMKHFGIESTDPGAWILLSFNLARTHVPAFQSRKPGGRRQYFQSKDGLHWVRVRRRMETYQESERAACYALAQEDRRGDMGRAYQDRYRRAKHNPVIRLLSEARALAPKAASFDELETLFRNMM